MIHKISRQKSHGILETVFLWSNFIYVLYTGFVWIYFYIPNLVMHVFMFLLFILYNHRHHSKVIISPNERSSIIVFILLAILHVLLMYPFFMVSLLPAMLLFFSDAETKEKLLAFTTKCFGILMAISIGIFVLSYLTTLPSLGIIDVGLTYEPYNNYLFFLQATSERWLDKIVYRFNGPFVEPGHLAMVSVFLIAANRFDFSSVYVKIIFVSILLSFSLAGYVLLALGYILLRLQSFRSLIVVAGVSAILVFGIIQYVGEENPISILILDRLELDDTGTNIEGFNRDRYDQEKVFERQMKVDGLLFGLSKSRYKELMERNIIGGAGYKTYFLQYGVISALLVFLLYYFFIKGYPDKRYAWGYFLLIAAAFLQRGYIATYAWMFPFICACSCSSGIRKVFHTDNRIRKEI